MPSRIAVSLAERPSKSASSVLANSGRCARTAFLSLARSALRAASVGVPSRRNAARWRAKDVGQARSGDGSDFGDWDWRFGLGTWAFMA